MASNNYQKMRRSHAKTDTFLAFFGWRTETAVHTRFKKDFFNLFDKVSVNRHGDVLWVQVKTNGYPTRAEKENIQGFCERHKQRCVFISWFKGVKNPKTWWFEPLAS